MKYPLMVSAALFVAFGQAQPASAQSPQDLVKQAVEAQGGANATASFRLEPAASGSKVLVHTDLLLSGAVAQYGRGVGVIQATAGQIMNQFAANLKAQLARPTSGTATPAREQMPPSSAEAPPPAAKPIAAFSLIVKVLWERFVGLFTGRSPSS